MERDEYERIVNTLSLKEVAVLSATELMMEGQVLFVELANAMVTTFIESAEELNNAVASLVQKGLLEFAALQRMKNADQKEKGVKVTKRGWEFYQVQSDDYEKRYQEMIQERRARKRRLSTT